MAELSSYLHLQNVQEHIRNAASFVADEAQACIEAQLEDEKVESPIEAIFKAWWIAYARTGNPDETQPDIFHQHQVVANGNRYRLDFIVLPDDPMILEEGKANELEFKDIAVELDGHDFHERTKEQVARRNKRDRDLQQAGWLIFHFSGSELHRDPLAVVEQVYVAGAEAIYDLSRQIMRKKWKQ